jgi:CubicO group peptidase (beta-lactamase class C family)
MLALALTACGSTEPSPAPPSSFPTAAAANRITAEPPPSVASPVQSTQVPSAPSPTAAPAASARPAVTAKPLPTVRTHDAALLDAVFTHGATGLAITAETPGCAVAIADGGAVVYSHGYGLANLSTKAPITPATVMDIGSVSKQFVAAAVLLLAQAGKLRLNDDVRRYLPDLPDYGKTVSLQEMLWMESGLPDYVNDGPMKDAGYDLTQPVTLGQEFAVVKKIHKLDFAPGTQYAYSNTNYFLLSLVVARLSGTSLAAFERTHIFGPLGMSSTYLDEAVGGNVPPGEAESYLFLPTLSFEPAVWGWAVGGPGGIHTNVLDLLRWAQNFTSGAVGGAAFLKAQLEMGPWTVTGVPAGRYAAGIVVQTRGARGDTVVLWHNGAWEGFRAALVIEPALQRTVALTCNMDIAGDGYDLGLTALDTWFGSP